MRRCNNRGLTDPFDYTTPGYKHHCGGLWVDEDDKDIEYESADPGVLNMAYERAREYLEDHGIDVPVHLRGAIAYALGHIKLEDL